MSETAAQRRKREAAEAEAAALDALTDEEREALANLSDEEAAQLAALATGAPQEPPAEPEDAPVADESPDELPDFSGLSRTELDEIVANADVLHAHGKLSKGIRDAARAARASLRR